MATPYPFHDWEPSATAPKVTRFADGGVDYTVSQPDGKLTLHVSAGDVLTGVDDSWDGVSSTERYTYGKQTVTLPAAGTVVSVEDVRKASFYVHPKEALSLHAVRVVNELGFDDGKITATRIRTGMKTVLASLPKYQRTAITATDVTGGVRIHLYSKRLKKRVGVRLTVKAGKAYIDDKGLPTVNPAS